MTIKVEEFAKAISYKCKDLDSSDYFEDYDSSERLAEHVLNFFGFGYETLDNHLEKEDRDIFYMLEDASLLRSESQEESLYTGQNWRIHKWIINEEKVDEYMRKFEEEMDEEVDFEGNVFGDLDSDKVEEAFKEHFEKQASRI